MVMKTMITMLLAIIVSGEVSIPKEPELMIWPLPKAIIINPRTTTDNMDHHPATVYSFHFE
ncbi:hypothetical protein Pmar_PMAR004675 [Perkinsus marinus ATCC 50983]|nr:hypothetical protein Pmar_PMAR004675 [Perkinsus marinus ATCC 50983]EER17501.1 hypothetical protein Pmar_PMAR004675 [Perkinsus marinus ATCC 50983]|eukprot:XP_002785705.1 hypothetical protein Pmar_PMAR004675 [Perkinsus marinus ATCC 50983]